MFAEVISDRGTGRAVVYLPGIDGSGKLLLGTADRLEERFRLLRLRYVLGMSPEHHSYDHLATSVVEAVSLRGVDSMVLLAESFGGAVAFRAALDFPRQVEALCLVNAFPHFRKRFGLALTRFGARMTPAWVVSWGRQWLAPVLLFGRSNGEIDKEAFRGTIQGWSLDDGYRARLRMIRGLDLRPELSRIHQPVALFASTKDRIVDAVRQGHAMEKLLPRAELHLLEGRGHVVLPCSDIDWPAHLERLLQRKRKPRPASERAPRCDPRS